MSKDLSEKGYNDYYDIDDLPLADDQKEMVLEWFAQKIWGGLSERGHCKSYDPLVIEAHNGSGVAHSYIFNMEDGGRHHDFHSLKELETWLEKEMQEYALCYAEDNGYTPAKQRNNAAKEPES